MSLLLYHETNTKKLEDLLVDNKPKLYEYELEKLPKPSADPQYKYLKYNLNSMTKFLLFLVISFLGPRLKIFRMSWYTSMKQFKDNLELVIKKYLCSLHYSFPGIDSKSVE